MVERVLKREDSLLDAIGIKELGAEGKKPIVESPQITPKLLDELWDKVTTPGKLPFGTKFYSGEGKEIGVDHVMWAICNDTAGLGEYDKALDRLKTLSGHPSAQVPENKRIIEGEIVRVRGLLHGTEEHPEAPPEPEAEEEFDMPAFLRREPPEAPVTTAFADNLSEVAREYSELESGTEESPVVPQGLRRKAPVGLHGMRRRGCALGALIVTFGALGIMLHLGNRPDVREMPERPPAVTTQAPDYVQHPPEVGVQQPTQNITGNWSSPGSGWGELSITQRGNEITGSYAHDNGRIRGQYNPREGLWEFQWEEEVRPGQDPNSGSGDARLRVSPDGKTIQLEWRWQNERDFARTGTATKLE